ncbi:MAG: D-alanine--D-alanine ligase, partial [Dongia sp.]
GRRGSGVEGIADVDALAAYLARFPEGRRLILQRLVRDEAEAGVFYVRRPGEKHGRIVSLTLKYFPKVIGDGRSTLRALIEADPRASQLSHLYHRRLGARLDSVPPAGTAVRLVEVGNHCKGAIFRNGQLYVTPAMEAAFAAISDEIPDFYFGRFDVRFRSLEDLRQGRGFTIIEVNGAGSEATHIWDRQTRLFDAYRGLFLQIRLAFEIGAANRRRGLKPMSGIALLRCYRAERKLLAAYL